MNKIINHENSSDLIQLVERRKSQENTKNNSNIKIVKLKFKKKEDIKTSNNFLVLFYQNLFYKNC